MKHVLLALPLLLPVAASAQDSWPGLYSVTGVASNDVLNIRTAPDASFDIIGSFGPYQTEIEVTGSDASGKWLRVNTQEQSGWVAARFMARDEGGDYALGRTLNCFGTEPFWSLDVIQGATATFSRMGEDPQGFRAGLAKRGAGRSDKYILGFGQGLMVASVAECSDGMSDRLYSISADVVMVEQGLNLQSGCCSIQPE